MPENPLVVIRSLVYNHEPYLRQCLDGFVMQQTTFPFVAVVHDDCSTDNSAAILREYAEKYPDIIKPVYETENQYSKRDGSLRRAMDAACKKYGPGAKYYALCEGDDCWTDPHKLQKQVEFMEAHPDYNLVFCNGVVQTRLKKLVSHADYVQAGWPHLEESGEVSTETMIADHSWMVHTAGMVVRSWVYEMYGKIRRKCPKCKNGDAVLQSICAVTGRSYYMADSMVVYRYQTPGSWSAANSPREKDAQARALPDSRVLDAKEYMRALDCINEYTQGKYEKIFFRVQFRYVADLMMTYPGSQKTLAASLGEYLLYSRVKRCMPAPQGKLWRCLYIVQMLICYPYYPCCATSQLANWLFRLFYMETEHKVTLHFGPVNIMSAVKGCRKHKFYLLGREIV